MKNYSPGLFMLQIAFKIRAAKMKLIECQGVQNKNVLYQIK